MNELMTLEGLSRKKREIIGIFHFVFENLPCTYITDNDLLLIPRIKNGSQQMIKAPVTIARVLAAFLSLLASSETCFFFFF